MVLATGALTPRHREQTQQKLLLVAQGGQAHRVDECRLSEERRI